MKFPEIPTDNLYKFMSLSGIVILIASFIPVYYAHKLKVKAIHLDEEIKTLRQEREWLTKDINDLEAASKRLWKRYDKYDEHATRKDASEHVSELTKIKTKLDTQAKDILKELLEISDLNRQTFVLEAQQRAKYKELKYLIIIMRMGLFLWGLGFAGGGFLAYKGFTLWHNKLQIPLDRIIKNKVKDEQKQ